MRVKASRLIEHVLGFCYPGRCANCEAPTDARATVCPDCEAELSTLAAQAYCDRCARPVQSLGAPCPHCLGGGVPHFERVIRLGVYKDPLKRLIRQMKYHRQWSLGEFLADRLLETERAKGILTETDALVPVPLHYLRHVSRGYNQADVIARRLGSRCGIPVVHAVRRVRNTPKQSLIHAHAMRQANVRGAFALSRRAEKLEGKHVVVIDDVLTSGETLRSVAQQLSVISPSSICAMTIAIRDRRGRGFEVVQSGR